MVHLLVSELRRFQKARCKDKNFEQIFVSASARRNWASPLGCLSGKDRATRLANSGGRLDRKIRTALTKLLAITGKFKSKNSRETCRKLPKLHPTNCILVRPVFYKISPQSDLYHQGNTEKGISSNIFFTLFVSVKSWQQACFVISNNFMSWMPIECK